MRSQPPRYPNYLQDEFDESVASHVLTVVHDLGLFRHLRCGRPGSSNMSFQITTWPGHLAMTGDMGSWVWSRLPDMFEFFREPNGRARINPSYWSEKLQAEDYRSGAMEFSDHAVRRATAAVVRSMREQDLDRAGIRDYIKDAKGATSAEEWNRATIEIDPDCWEAELEDFSYHYLWACHAVVWAIKQYDAAKQAPVEAACGGAS